jgi:hypothetical protein
MIFSCVVYIVQERWLFIHSPFVLDPEWKGKRLNKDLLKKKVSHNNRRQILS